MKKEHKIYAFGFVAILILAAVAVLSLHSVQAQNQSGTPFAGVAQTPEEAVQQTIGVNPENIPQSPEQIKEAYLKQEWGKIVASWPVIGPIHNFLSENPLVFKIIFNEPYAISPTLFLVIIFWLIVGIYSSKMLASSGIINKAFAIPAGFAFTIVMAHISIYNFIASSLVLFTLSKDGWLARSLIIIIISAVIIAVAFLFRYIDMEIKAARVAKAKAELEHKVKKSEKFMQGVEKGQKIVEDFT